MTRHDFGRPTRLITALVLLCGATALTSAPAFAISGPAGSTDAAAAQYVAASEEPQPQAGEPQAGEPQAGENFPLGEQTPPTPVPEGEPLAQNPVPPPLALNQGENEKGQLPFTGYVVLVTILAGLFALLLGLLLRRRTEQDPQPA